MKKEIAIVCECSFGHISSIFFLNQAVFEFIYKDNETFFKSCEDIFNYRKNTQQQTFISVFNVICN